ncbi:MAG: L-fuconate dehydratase [Gammaproteobacteria bacterium]|nr:L-fuconate dehydratase [Gammaproteobacteria bacterium]
MSLANKNNTTSLIITDLEVRDIRFPTSRTLDGSDAMNVAPDYSAAYITLKTNDPQLTGYGLTFTIGRGNDLCVAAIQLLKHQLINKKFSDITRDMGKFWSTLTGDSQLRWLGPDKGVIHLAVAAVVNAVWDLWARQMKKPLWRLIVDMSPEELVHCLDFSYVTDVLTPDDALNILRAQIPGRAERITNLLAKGYPAYTTSAGWLGYPDDKLRKLCHDAVDAGWKHLKFKVGADRKQDIKRLAIAREALGNDITIMVDANQKWEVSEAIDWIKDLKPFNPWWIEEPTSPDDILGHATIRQSIKPIRVATGEHCQNRIMFKQLLQAKAIDVCQIDSCRLGGVNENIIVLLMAAKFGVPVCPHAGGVGLCEYAQHLSMIDYIAISGSLENRVLEYVNHLHEHFVSPAIVHDAHYQVPLQPGYSIEIKPETLRDYEYPAGKIWQ